MRAPTDLPSLTAVRARSLATNRSPGYGSGQAEKDEDGTIETDDILVGQPTDASLQLRLGDRCDLIDHQLTGGVQSVPF